MPQADKARVSHRGRPPAVEKRNVSTDIYRAAEESLYHRSSSEITAKEIADRAKTTEAMVVYYYGTKEKLFAEIVETSLSDIQAELIELSKKVQSAHLYSTRDLIREIINIYFDRLPAARILATELNKDSSHIKSRYTSRWTKETTGIISNIIGVLISRGMYRSDLDVHQFVMALKSVIVYPMICDSYAEMEGFRLTSFRESAWINLLAEMLDGFLTGGNSVERLTGRSESKS